MTSSVPFNVATLATSNAIRDLNVLLFTLELWHDIPPTVWLFCDEAVKNWLTTRQPKYPGKIHTQLALQRYTGLTRQQMEHSPGLSSPSLFGDFTEEKTELMNWAIRASGSKPGGVFFLDADITLLGPLPLPLSLPKDVKLVLSPHFIRPSDEAKFGHFNAGFIWTNDPTFPVEWKEACGYSRFFEQAALEDFAQRADVFEREHNYGWWRMFQSEKSVKENKDEWKIARADMDDGFCGIRIGSVPLRSVHLHWYDPSTNDFALFVIEKLRLTTKGKYGLASKSARLLRFLTSF